ncbi:hypothetical protein PUN28_002222 [Cardiocondyla obscurior]|uniref:Uncharacterized protein n=1 Tax=Cardiocondyla obscurior TaxID=286306 RepID=A0AAW2GT49_9HYME
MAHLYKIVLFEDDKKAKTLSVDIVPTSWIFTSEKFNSKVCRFPVGLFTDSQISNLHKKIKNCQPADKSWPIHRIKVHGRAHTYKEACAAVEKLEYNRYAFSTDREFSVERRVFVENQINKNFPKSRNNEVLSFYSSDYSVEGNKENTPNKLKEKNYIESSQSEGYSSSDSEYSLNCSCSEIPKLHTRPRLLYSEAGSKSNKTMTLNSLTAFIEKIYHSLSCKLDRLQGSQVEINVKLDKPLNISRHKTLIKSEKKIEDNQILLPINTKKIFDVFDTKLKEDKEYRCKIVSDFNLLL